MMIVHHIRKFEDIKIFTHCPNCKTDWLKQTKQITDGIKQITDKSISVLPTPPAMKRYDTKCPKCNFHIMYIIHPFKNIRKVNGGEQKPGKPPARLI
jgi:rubredoxin